MDIKDQLFVKNWNNSYERGENNILYPQAEVVKFLNRFIKKKINYSGIFEEVLHIRGDQNKLKALDFGCGVARHAILIEEFGIECYGVDISKEAISKGKINAKKLGFDQIAKRLSVIQEKKLYFEDNFFDFSIAESSLDSMTFENAKIFFEELCRVTNRYIHLTLIASESSGDPNFTNDIIVKSEHEYGTVQSYYDLKKIKLLLGEGLYSKIIFNRKITEVSLIDSFTHARFHLVIDLKKK
jgi:SAM-dependent methyltransferase